MEDLLKNLPSRKAFLTADDGQGVLIKPPSFYVCTHNTTPPESQVLKCSEALEMLSDRTKKAAADGNGAAQHDGKKAKGGGGKVGSKRAATDAAAADGPAAKRASKAATAAAGCSEQEPTTFTRAALQKSTVAVLKEWCRARSLAVVGKKDELITRLLEHHKQHGKKK